MSFLLEGTTTAAWQQAVMYVVGIILTWLVVKKEYEPSPLLPLGFGAILANLSYSGVADQTVQGKIPATGIIEWLSKTGIEASEAMPTLLFTGIGTMTDFGPLLSQPVLFLFGAAAQFGISAAIPIACLTGFDLRDAVSIGIIGVANGPTSVPISRALGSGYIGPIAVAAYSYMVLAPITQPFAIRLVTIRKERCIHMEYNLKSVNKQLHIAFSIVMTIIVGLISPQSVALVGFLMFGNLFRECGVLGNLRQTVQNEFANIIILLLGITVPFSMRAKQFANPVTLMIMVLDLMAPVFDTVGGVFFVKLINVSLKMAGKKPVSPMIGGCDTFAFPISFRVVQKVAAREEPGNTILIQAVGTNVSGQVASITAGGLTISIVSQYLQSGGNEISNRLRSRQ